MQGQRPSSTIPPLLTMFFLSEQVIFFQILFLCTNDTYSNDTPTVFERYQALQEQTKLRELRKLKDLGVQIVPVAIGKNASVKRLRKILSMPDRVIWCGVNEDPSKLGCKLFRGNYSIAYFFVKI